MASFINTLELHNVCIKDKKLFRIPLTTLQINLGNLCNQSCSHCHINASPKGDKVMSKKIIDDILQFLKTNSNLILDITGGAPEMNQHFEHLVVNAKPFVKEIIVRSNLTILTMENKLHLPSFYKENNIHLICSLPCYSSENVDNQRGEGTFNKSISALQKLNSLGYGKDLQLDLVYNPLGAFLPPSQETLTQDYKKQLLQNYGIEFNKLITITNVPIKRFKDNLDKIGQYQKYVNLLKDNFNPSTVENLMCRSYLSVGYDGVLYDCDFNQALAWPIKNEDENVLTIDQINQRVLAEIDIQVGEHCFSCTAGVGSSCQGSISDDG